MTLDASLTRRALRVRARAELAASVIAPYYGLDAAIAVNPVLPALSGGFARALTEAVPALGARGSLSEAEYRRHLATGRITRADLAAAIRRRADAPSTQGAEALVDDFLAAPGIAEHAERAPLGRVDDAVTHWCRIALTPEAAAWPVPVATLGFFGAWKALARHDRTLSGDARRRIAALPDTPEAALVMALEGIGVDDDAQLAYLKAGLVAVPGWAAYVRWRAQTSGDVDIVELLAVRTSLAWAWDETPDVTLARVPAHDGTTAEVDRVLVWQEAFEAPAHRRVLERVNHPAVQTSQDTSSVAAHLVFCIDPRSEGLRRHLEGHGPYATSGFAGFFGIAALVEPLAATEPSAACPVLLTPRYRVNERPMPGAWREASRFVTGLGFRQALRSGLKAPDAVAGAPLGWAEVTGWVLGPRSAARSVLAGRGGSDGRPDDPALRVPTLLDVDSALTPEDQVETAEVILRTMGMVESFAPLVVFVGHGTSTTNNAFRTALDCGACGGHRGAPNARVAAAILNAPAVRAGLAERGITIPDGTLFLAAEHDTATDEVMFADQDRLPVEVHDTMEALQRDAQAAGRALATERAAELPGASARGSASTTVARRSRDWAQVYPEWGLARNAALVIGPRSLTAGADLERRAFLHSYEARHDPEGTALETILTAPLVVAHWINAQYYFSAVDPEVFGAGSKTVHNLVAGAGVLSGPSGDLRLGLPWQSVGTRAGLHHEPVRLLVVVDAPRERIDRIVDRADVVKDLVHGEWVILVRPGTADGDWERCTADGWKPWASELLDQTYGREAA